MKSNDASSENTPCEFVKPADVAARYAVTIRTVHRWIEQGLFPAVRRQKVTRIRMEDVIQALEGKLKTNA